MVSPLSSIGKLEKQTFSEGQRTRTMTEGEEHTLRKGGESTSYVSRPAYVALIMDDCRKHWNLVLLQRRFIVLPSVEQSWSFHYVVLCTPVVEMCTVHW